ncbi:stage II sporulation protein D [Ruminiclostridium cellulolyticum]|uniref:Stage II sporulation protein D n=1 Tax=Ruminiclostridium cellulolyticum (strain ATCC 35319 / DSM 5812 / JCM 6584 / H10) TaxID=394503 RepID=B8I588_RUMCH|nr:stage II sporulation protein D [Ruminiclostridium cellulolyticum]ACL74668.1 stage II sporulation protein D [Ruminiclostridium cellulolyticum H10]
MKKVITYILLMAFIVVLVPFMVVQFNGKEVGPVQIQDKEKSNVTPKQETAITINVYMHTQKKTVKMYLEDYIKGVLAAEMPAEFEIEALKAQAVAARTYALGRAVKLYGSVGVHDDADVCTDSRHCQAWKSKEQAMENWGLLSSFKYWNKITRAVNETQGQVIEYNKVLINPLFHSNSGGYTENVEDVWDGTSEPYLRGVKSVGEDEFREYKSVIELLESDMIKILKKNNPKIQIKGNNLFANIKINGYSSGNRVLSMDIGNVKVKGTDFRKMFNLKSTNFKLKKLAGGKISITTYGYGHGVGMSQCGANYLAQQGSHYKEILKYYYKGVEITRLDSSQKK